MESSGKSSQVVGIEENINFDWYRGRFERVISSGNYSKIEEKFPYQTNSRYNFDRARKLSRNS